ncbi:MAG: glycogen/starch synthase, partial [Firmicutes bacterium]|nr:glycogen/starch synthase [Bacillota bacterium]
MKNVLIISSEGVPFAKSGGLGDVIGALPKELKKQGVNVRVILPLYKTVKDTYGDQLKFIEAY